MRLRLAPEHPVVLLVLDQLRDAPGKPDVEAAVARTGFKQQDAMRAAGTEAVGEHAAGRTATDDPVVVCHRRPPACLRAAVLCAPPRSDEHTSELQSLKPT